MDDLAFLHGRIESYADYTNDDARRLTDEQIRAYVGEALSRLSERLNPADSAGELLARLLLRCQFADQVVIRAFDAESFGASAALAIHGIDRELVDLADRAGSITANDVGAYLVRIETALDARAAMIRGVAAATPATPPR